MAAVGAPDPEVGSTVMTAVRHIRRGAAEYADRLEDLGRPPPELWARGPLRLPGQRMVSIVGTRRATEYGRRMAADIAYGVATAGWTVVSGLARGIDAAAHRGALEARGATVAVLGCGIDRVFPATNRDLSSAIAREGLLLTEFAPGTAPRKHHFPQRNRIIAALADAVVVVQAGLPSGALITADEALGLSREVLAVPGPADQAVSHGTHRLLRDGATIVTSADDVLAILEDGAARSPSPQTSLFAARSAPGGTGPTPGERIRAELADGPASLEQVAALAGLTMPQAMATLGRMELRGAVRSLPGLRFELVERP